MATASRLEARIEDKDTAIRNRQSSNYLFIYKKIISRCGIVLHILL
jgi:hypothetical protein